MEAPAYFLKELQAFDPDLRVRWSRRLEAWQIERKVRRSLHPGTIRCDEYHDDWLRARDGYLLVATVPPHGLSRHVLETLKASDLWVHGWKKIAAEIEAREEAEEEKKWRDFSDDMKAYSAEVFDFLARREGRQVFNAGFVD